MGEDAPAIGRREGLGRDVRVLVAGAGAKERLAAEGVQIGNRDAACGHRNRPSRPHAVDHVNRRFAAEDVRHEFGGRLAQGADGADAGGGDVRRDDRLRQGGRG